MGSTVRKIWRCFHCDEVFRSRKAAWAHFGPDDSCEKPPPACMDPLRLDEKTRLAELREAQQYALECQEKANESEDKFDDAQRELDEFRSVIKCANIHELRVWMDYQEGRVLTADALIKAVHAKAPAIYQEVIQ